MVEFVQSVAMNRAQRHERAGKALERLADALVMARLAQCALDGCHMDAIPQVDGDFAGQKIREVVYQLAGLRDYAAGLRHSSRPEEEYEEPDRTEQSEAEEAADVHLSGHDGIE